MEKLAPELIQRIFSHIDSAPDIASFRLVQRSFAELGTEYFFKSIDIKPTYHSLHHLLKISQNAEFSRYVKQVVLHLDDFRHSIWIPFTNKLRTDNLEDSTPAQKSGVLEKLIREFQDFERSPDYSGILSSAFMGLPNLEAIQILESPSRKGIDSQTRIDIDEYSISEFSLPMTQWGAYASYWAFYSLVSAAYFATVKLVSFRNNADIPDTSDGFILYNRKELVRRAATVFQNCPILELAFAQADGHLIIDLLTPTVRVERLGLKSDVAIYGDVISSFAQRTYVWSGLKEVELRMALMGNPDLEDFLVFLQRHSATLRGLALWDCKLTTGSWARLIVCAKETLKLEWFELGPLSDASKTYSRVELEGMMHYVLNLNSSKLPPCLR